MYSIVFKYLFDLYVKTIMNPKFEIPDHTKFRYT